jgi:hypothetical protein
VESNNQNNVELIAAMRDSPAARLHSN